MKYVKIKIDDLTEMFDDEELSDIIENAAEKMEEKITI